MIKQTIAFNAQQMYNSQVVYQEALKAQKYAHKQNEQYDEIRPFCPVCMIRHRAGSPPAEDPTHRGVFRCRECVNKRYPVPIYLIDPEALDGLLSM